MGQPGLSIPLCRISNMTVNEEFVVVKLKEDAVLGMIFLTRQGHRVDSDNISQTQQVLHMPRISVIRLQSTLFF